MLLRRYRRAVACETDTICFKESLLGVLGVFARQILDERLDIVGKTDMQAAAKVLLFAIDSIGSRWKNMLWYAPGRLCPTETFPAGITHFLCNCLRDYSLYEMEMVLPLSQWSEKGERGSIKRMWTLCSLWNVEERSGHEEVAG